MFHNARFSSGNADYGTGLEESSSMNHLNVFRPGTRALRLPLAWLGLFFLLLGPAALCAQSGYEDVVYLKNGSVIRGVIIEQVPNASIKIKTQDRNIFVFQLNEVDRIAKEELTRSRQRSFAEPDANPVQFSLVIGLASPIGDFGRKEYSNRNSMYAKEGLHFAIQVDYWPSRRFGVIGSLSVQKNEFDFDAYSAGFVASNQPYYTTGVQSNPTKYSSSLGSLGVIVGLVKGGGAAELDVYGMAGYNTVKRSEFTATFAWINGSSHSFTYPAKESSNIATTFGGRLNLKVSSRLRLLSVAQVTTSKLIGFDTIGRQGGEVGYGTLGFLAGLQLTL